MKRTVLATLAGFILWGGLWVTPNMLALRLAPSRFAADGSTHDAALLSTFVVSAALISIASGFATERLGGQPAVKALAVLLLAVGIAVEASHWSTLPLLFHIAFIAVLAPATLAGGALSSSKKRFSHETTRRQWT